MRRLFRLIAVVVGFSIGMLGVTAAFGYTNHFGGGKETQSVVQGSDVKIRGLTFNPRLNQCVMYLTMVRNYTTPVHNEAGLTICRDFTIDGTCTSHYGFAEVWTGGSYFCNRGNYFTVGTAYPVDVTQYSPSPGWTYSFAAGATHSANGFNAGDSIYGYALPESTEQSGVGCPLTPHDGEFRDWQKQVGYSWSLVSGTGYSASSPTGLPVCWNFSSGATGDFDVF